MSKKRHSLAVEFETDKAPNYDPSIEIENCLKIREVKRCEECCRFNEGCETRKGVE